MKKILFFASLLMMALLSSCGEDNTTNDPGNGGGTTPPKTIIAFAKTQTVMATQCNVEVDLLTGDGKPFTATEDVKVKIGVNAEKTTAEKSVDFSLSDGDEVTIKKGESKGIVKVTMITDEPKANRNVIALTLEPVDKDKFIVGEKSLCTIAMIGNIGEKIIGKWKTKFLVTNLKFMQEQWGDMVTFPQTADDGFPNQEVDDTMTFGEDGTLTTQFKSTFKNFFGPKATYKFHSYYDLKTGKNNFIPLVLLEVDHINRYFSKKEKSEDDKALVGFKFTPDGNDLMVYLIDYYSKSFGLEWIDAEMYEKQKPMVIVYGMYMQFTMEKVAQ